MSLEFLDSFDVNDGVRYVGFTPASGTGIVTAGYGRHSSGNNGAALVNTTITGGSLPRAIAVPKATIGQGIAYRTDNAGPGDGRTVSVMGFNGASGPSLRHITIAFNSAGNVVVYRGSSNGGTLLTTSDQAPRPAQGSYAHVEALVTVDDVTGSVQVKVNEQVMTFGGLSTWTGDTRNGGTDSLIYSVACCWDQNQGGNSRWDDWTCWNTLGTRFNTWIGDKNVGSSGPNAAGTYSNGTASSGTQLSCVDEVSPNWDGDYVSLATVGDKLSMNMADCVASALNLTAVVISAIVRKDDAGSDMGRLFGISGATEDDGGGVDVAVPSGYTEFARLYEQDWNGPADWTIARFNAIEVGWHRTA